MSVCGCTCSLLSKYKISESPWCRSGHGEAVIRYIMLTHVFSGAPLSRQLPAQIRSGREENVCHNSEQLVDELEMLQFRSQDYNQCSISAFEFNMTASLEPALPGPGHRAAPGGLCLVVEMFQQDAARAGEAEEPTRVLLPTRGLTLLPLLRTEHHNLSRLYLHLKRFMREIIFCVNFSKFLPWILSCLQPQPGTKYPFPHSGERRPETRHRRSPSCDTRPCRYCITGFMYEEEPCCYK